MYKFKNDKVKAMSSSSTSTFMESTETIMNLYNRRYNSSCEKNIRVCKLVKYILNIKILIPGELIWINSGAQ